MKIIFACGGTGGHIFPAVSVCEEIKSRVPGAEMLFVCGKRELENTILSGLIHERLVSIHSAPFRGPRSLWNPAFLVKSLAGFCQAFVLMRREKPDAVVGFGGYVSFPVLLAAKTAGIRTMVHEQNVIPGLANRVLARVAEGVALSHSETKDHLPPLKRIHITGNPIRAFIERPCRVEALEFFGFSDERVTLLVLGGSQGAESVNRFFLAALENVDQAVKEKIQVLHLCGRMPVSTAADRYKVLGVRARVYSFFERMDLAYGAADFALGRAGATFLAEIAVKKIPAILIPYPYGDGHQRFNAKLFSQKNEATVLEQRGLTAERLAQVLTQQIRRSSSTVRPKTEVSSSRRLLSDFILETAASP